jgi:tetratricopeptide (TPR) repeat protein
MGDQPEDLYTRAAGGAEPGGWIDAAPPESTPFDAPPAYPPAYQPTDAAPPHEAPVPAYDNTLSDTYSAPDGNMSQQAIEPERPTQTAVLDEPWTPAPFAPATPAYDDKTAPSLHMALPEEPQRPILAEPFPLSWTLGVVAGVALALAVAFLAQALLVRGDWAEAALVAGYTAFGLAAFALVLAIVRVALGRRAGVFFALAGLLLATLLATGGGALALAHQLHLVQARSYEGAGKWEQAAKEYALYGERAPHAPNLGRVYLRWGQDLAQQQAWSEAANHLSAALAANPTDTALAAKVNTSLYTTFAGWLRADPTKVPYPAAIEEFTTQRSASTCDAACQSESASLEAQARYLYGQQLLSDQRYAEAATQFAAIEAQFASSAYAGQAHTAAATAYLALGQQQIASKTCVDAVPTYQTLVKSYGDTPAGPQAAAALAAPQNVTGKLVNYPTTNPIPRAHLSKFANPANFVFSNEYNAAVDSATGAFTFTKVAQGAYNLSTSRTQSFKTEFHYFHSASGDLYSVKVGPLCALDLGSITY